MFAIAVSSDAIASAVKIAVAAHLRRSAGRPSIATDRFAEIVSVDIRKALRFNFELSGGVGQTQSFGDQLLDGFRVTERASLAGNVSFSSSSSRSSA
jgi:hypothetical protein